MISMDDTQIEMPSKPAHFFAQLKGSPAGIWTTISGVVLMLVIWLVGTGAVVLASPLVRTLLSEPETIFSARDEALGMFLLLVGGFGPQFIIVMWWRKTLEKRAIATLFTAAPRFRWGLAVASTMFVLTMGLVLTLPFDSESVASLQARLARFSLQDWLMLVAAYTIGISVQATFEEVLVRGWLLQHLSRLIPNVVVSILVTSALFSAMHAGHPGWATYAVTFVMGVAFGWSAWRLNGLEAAIGAHIANNLFAALLFGQMISGNAPTMDATDAVLYGVYILGFLLFVEGWARFGMKPSRA